jgi:ABC-type sugar transport system ATPase subunit
MLSVINTSKSFSGLSILRKVSFDVDQGNALAIFGKSGSGKTTILRIIAGLLSPDTGTIFINNTDFTKVPPYKRPVGFQFQSYALFPNLNVLQNLRYPIINRSEDNSSLNKIIDQLSLSELLQRRIDKLSGGEQQRVALGRALISAIVTNGVLLLDEPVSALDEGLRETARIMIRELQKQFNLTTVFITHDSKDIIRMADKMAILDEGTIIQQGSIPEVSAKPASENVAISFGFKYIGDCHVKNRHITYAGMEFPLPHNTFDDNTTYKCYVSNETIRTSSDHHSDCIKGIVDNIAETKSYYHYTIKVADHLITYDSHKQENEKFKTNQEIRLLINWESVLFFKKSKL